MARYNLDSIIGKCVHRPIASNDADKLPLYKRNDGMFDENGNGKTTRTPAWLSASERTYNSPNNVRRIFITYKGVYVTYWRQFNGLKELTKYYPYERVNDTFKPLELATHALDGSVYKSGLGAIRGRWTCSNIEEIYFDWTLLLSADLIKLNLGSLYQTMTSKGTTNIQSGAVLNLLFEYACLNKGEQMSRVFPRLRVIGYISMLDRVLDMYRPKAGEESGKDLMTPWYCNPIVSKAAQDPNVYVAIYKVPNVSAANFKFVTRSFYCFDVEVLEPHFEKLKSKLSAEQAARRKGMEATNKDSDLKKLLDDIESKNGLQAAKQMLVVMLRLSDNKPELLATLPESDRIKYGGSK